MANFYQIEDCLRSLRVPFDAKITHQVMNEENGAAIRLLYQLKLSIDRHFGKGIRSVTGLRPNTVESKMRKVSELTRSLPKLSKLEPTFKHKHKPLKDIETKLLRYEHARSALEKKAKNDEMAEINMLKSMQQTKRQDAHKNLKEN